MAFLPIGKGIQVSLTDLQSEVNQMFDRMWHGGISTAPLDGQEWAPAMDLIEEPTRYLLVAEVPGLVVEEIEVTFERNELIFKGHKPVGYGESEDSRLVHRERRNGKFSRRVTIPEAIDPDGISATCRRGMLEVVLPKKQPSQRQSVKIQVSGE